MKKYGASFGFKLSKELKKAIKEESKRQELSMSEWCRRSLSGMIHIGNLLNLGERSGSSPRIQHLRPPKSDIKPLPTPGKSEDYRQVVAELKIVLEGRKVWVEANGD